MAYSHTTGNSGVPSCVKITLGDDKVQACDECAMQYETHNGKAAHAFTLGQPDKCHKCGCRHDTAGTPCDEGTSDCTCYSLGGVTVDAFDGYAVGNSCIPRKQAKETFAPGVIVGIVMAIIVTAGGLTWSYHRWAIAGGRTRSCRDCLCWPSWCPRPGMPSWPRKGAGTAARATAYQAMGDDGRYVEVAAP